MRKISSLDDHSVPSVISPSVLGVLIYGTLLRFLSIYGLCTLQYPTEEQSLEFGAAFQSLGTCLTIANVGLFAWLAMEAYQAWGRKDDFRRGRQVGRLLALGYLVGTQYLVLSASEVLGTGLAGR